MAYDGEEGKKEVMEKIKELTESVPEDQRKDTYFSSYDVSHWYAKMAGKRLEELTDEGKLERKYKYRSHYPEVKLTPIYKLKEEPKQP